MENGIEMVMDNIQQLRTVINRIRADSSHSTNPLTMKLNGTLDAAVNGGVSKFEVCIILCRRASSLPGGVVHLVQPVVGVMIGLSVLVQWINKGVFFYTNS